MLIDTHVHLDAPELSADLDAVVARAKAAGVGMLVIPAVERANFARVRELAYAYDCVYALGIHPMYTPHAELADLAALEAALDLSDPRLVAVGEIGLDFFVPELIEPQAREKQITLYAAQLKIAKRAGLPVLLHVRRSQDMLLKYLRRTPVSGIAHAFNGSDAQAAQFAALGFCMGFGGQATHERALQIRKLFKELPAAQIVLETDAPDIAPAWNYKGRNESSELAKIAATLAPLREMSAAELAALSTQNARRALPRLDALVKSAAI
jgi:TatD DNase family protein